MEPGRKSISPAAVVQDVVLLQSVDDAAQEQIRIFFVFSQAANAGMATAGARPDWIPRRGTAAA